MMKNLDDKLTVANGWYRVDDTDPYAIRHYGLVPVTITVIDTWTTSTKDGTVIDLVAYFHIDTKTITTNDPALLIPDEWLYGPQSLILTSGAVDLLRL